MDTITAIATVLGESAIGIIRISGDMALEIGEKLFRTKSSKSFGDFEPRKMLYGNVFDSNGDKIDEVMAVYLSAPNTYTCEDMIEINTHGGMVPMRRLISEILSLGARMAEPGEFTKRGFLNGRIDLSQAEAVMDLISAKTGESFKLSFNQLEGSLTSEVDNLRKDILEVMARLTISIDYPEEDIEDITYDEIGNTLELTGKKIDDLLISSEKGKIIKEGINTAIIGKPNVGKSSLMNALLRESRAIVTDIPGTTRDIIEESINIKGIPLRIVDTAGIRETDNVVEKIGVERSKEVFNKSDLIIMVLNGAEALTEEDIEILGLLRDRNSVIFINKTDLDRVIDIEKVKDLIGTHPVIMGSMTKSHGLDELENMIYELALGKNYKFDSHSAFLSNVRQVNEMKNAKQSIEDALEGIKTMQPYDFIEVDVKDAYEYLGKVTGASADGDILDEIFSNFCIGK